MSNAISRPAMSGVWSEGFIMTALPATTAAAVIPVRIASGKFQGAMTMPTPRGHQCWKFDSPATCWVRWGRPSSRMTAA